MAWDGGVSYCYDGNYFAIYKCVKSIHCTPYMNLSYMDWSLSDPNRYFKNLPNGKQDTW